MKPVAPAAVVAAAGAARADAAAERDAAGDDDAGAIRWSDALSAAALLAVDPQALGGVRLRMGAGALRDAWFAHLRSFLDADTALRRVPASVDEARLVGGIDLAATLRCGRPVAEQGLLAQSDQGVLVVPMAERMRPVTAALMAAVLDEGALRMERDGFSLLAPARLAVIACDEGLAADELPPPALLERLALWLDLGAVQGRAAALAEALVPPPEPEQLRAARACLAGVAVPPQLHEALCRACTALGIDSLRVPLLALRAARAAAALAGAASCGPEHAALATRLVIAPRARQLPAAADPGEEGEEGTQGEQSPPDPAPGEENAARTPDDAAARDDPGISVDDPAALAEIVLEAARAALPADLLAQISRGALRRGAGATPGRTGVQLRSKLRGRPVGVRRGELRGGARLHVLETLRSAAPWQSIRGRAPGAVAMCPQRLEVRREDFRVVRYSQRTQTTVIFVVDASGSAALHRLAEAKGAVELFLADCYVRRDQVALIAFRGRAAELLLPPTRSLARARRCLAGVPGGGGTPIAAGLRMAAGVADAVRRRGDVPLLVLLTDGKANVALDGTGGREQAAADALAMARALRATAIRALLVDFAPRMQVEAQALAREAGARYLALPRADAALVAGAVRSVRAQIR